MRVVKNTSQHSTRKLKSIASAVHNHLAKREGRLKRWATLRVKVRGKCGNWSGRAYMPGWRGWEWDVFLSLGPELSDQKIAAAFYHELMHSYGYNHRQGCDASDKELEAIVATLPWATAHQSG